MTAIKITQQNIAMYSKPSLARFANGERFSGGWVIASDGKLHGVALVEADQVYISPLKGRKTRRVMELVKLTCFTRGTVLSSRGA